MQPCRSTISYAKGFGEYLGLQASQSLNPHPPAVIAILAFFSLTFRSQGAGYKKPFFNGLHSLGVTGLCL